ncbi:MAG: sulfatase [Acidobacteriota bacterium]
MPQLTRRNLLAGMAATPALPSAPAQPGGGPLNLISIMVDTWGPTWLGCYGNAEIRTPHVDALARRSALFLDAYAEALPTLPARRALYTGRRIFPSELIVQPDDTVRIRGWHQFYAEDVTLAETLQAAGYTTGFVSDVYHQFKPGKNFHRGFDSWRWIRGQEGDRLESGPRKGINLAGYLHPTQPAGARSGVMQYLVNRRGWKSEDDWLAARVFDEASRWLENNAGENQPFYLHIESFTPHEFWDPPEPWYRQYMKQDYRGPWLLSPPATTAKMSPAEVAHVRALYAGLAGFTDDRTGKFLAVAERLGLMKNTLIAFTADHGAMMGEQNQLHKGETRIRRQVAQVPLIFYHPRENWAGRRIGGFVQHTDVMPTLLDLVGVRPPARVTGESLRPLIGGAGSRRESIITGWGEHAAVRTPEWCYIGRWSPGPPFEELYDVRKDPLELTNVAGAHPAAVQEFRSTVKRYVDEGWALTRGSFATVLKGPQG